MKFTVQAAPLAAILKQCGRVASKKAGDINGNFLIDVQDGHLNVTANNGHQQMSLHLQDPSLIVREAGSVCISASKFEQIVSSLPVDRDVTVSVGEEKATVTCGRSRFSIATLPASSFPKALHSDGQVQTALTIESHSLRDGIRGIAFCVARNDVRQYLNGLLFEASEGKLTLVGTDGHRMGMVELQIEKSSSMKFILPVACLEDVASFASYGYVTITHSGNLVSFTAVNGTMTSRLVDGAFPNYCALIERAETGQLINLNRDAITSAVARVSLLSDAKSQAVRLKFGQQRVEVVSVSNDALSEAEDLLPCDFDAAPFDVGFNSRYAQEAFKAVSSTDLQLFYSGPASGTLIKAKDCPHQKFVLMPVRL